MIGALILGLVAGFIGRALVPNDIFSTMSGPSSWAVSIVLGFAGAFDKVKVGIRAPSEVPLLRTEISVAPEHRSSDRMGRVAH